MQRRQFLAASLAPAFIPASLLGQNAPSRRITVGMIGVGRQCRQVNIPQLLSMPDVEITAVCDVDSWRLANAVQQVGRGVKPYRDYRELLADKSIDAVMISTPDHWHVPMALDAVKAGKDVSLEKPITRSIAEGRRLADAVKKYGRVFRTDSEFRSTKTFHAAAELVLNGRLGELRKITTGVPKGDIGCPPQPDMPVPPDLDYDLWQGPAPRAAYTEARVHKPRAYERPGWMRHLYYCDGMVTNWGTHLNDIAQWGNGTDRTGPVEVEARGTYPEPSSFWNVLLDFEAHYRYANGVTLTYKIDQPYVLFEGSEGKVYADFTKLEATPMRVPDFKMGPDWKALPFKSDKRDWIDAIKTRGQTLADAEVGHRTTSVCHLAHIAIHVGGRLQWDPQTERFTNSDKANWFIDKPIQKPYTVS
jgi:predicted dehydrogenase